MQLYFKLIGAKIRSQMQYRASFWADLLGFALLTGLDFAVLAIVVGRFGTLNGWRLPELALLYGVAAAGFGCAEMVMRGFDAPFEQQMITGSFDTVLLRPRGAFFQTLASEFQLRRLGRVVQGLAALTYGLRSVPVLWSADRVLLLPLALLGAALIYGALIVAGSALAFWTVRTPEVLNALTFGGVELASYPLSIYTPTLRALVVFVVPIGLTSYPAALWLLGRSDPYGLPGWLAWLTPLIGAGLLTLAYLAWRSGVGKYQSSGT